MSSAFLKELKGLKSEIKSLRKQLDKKGGGSKKRLSIHKSSKKKGDNRTAFPTFSKTKLLGDADEDDMEKMCKLLGTDSSGNRDALIQRLKNKMTRDNWLKLDDRKKGKIVHGLGVTLKNMFQCAGFQQSSKEYENADDYRYNVVLNSFR